MKTILSIGSNMGDRRGYIDGALEQLEQKAGRILAVCDRDQGLRADRAG